MVQQLVAVLGRGVVPTDEGLGTADDAGMVRGDGCFDATLLRDGHLYDLEEHLARLVHSCALLELPAPDLDAWRALIDGAVRAWDGTEAALKLVITRGPEHGGSPTSFLTLTSLTETIVAQRAGIAVVTLDRGYPSDAFGSAPWLLGGAKTLSYAVNMAAKRQAARLGADDVVFTSSDGYVLEAPTSVVIWRRNKTLYSTPRGATGILASISLDKVFDGAEDRGFQADFALCTPEEIELSDGAWLVSSVRGTAPILMFNGVRLAQDPDVTAVIRSLNGF